MTSNRHFVKLNTFVNALTRVLTNKFAKNLEQSVSEKISKRPSQSGQLPSYQTLRFFAILFGLTVLVIVVLSKVQRAPQLKSEQKLEKNSISNPKRKESFDSNSAASI